MAYNRTPCTAVNMSATLTFILNPPLNLLEQRRDHMKIIKTKTRKKATLQSLLLRCFQSAWLHVVSTGWRYCLPSAVPRNEVHDLLHDDMSARLVADRRRTGNRLGIPSDERRLVCEREKICILLVRLFFGSVRSAYECCFSFSFYSVRFDHVTSIYI
jgi:hypothetical protein